VRKLKQLPLKWNVLSSRKKLMPSTSVSLKNRPQLLRLNVSVCRKNLKLLKPFVFEKKRRPLLLQKLPEKRKLRLKLPANANTSLRMKKLLLCARSKRRRLRLSESDVRKLKTPPSRSVSRTSRRKTRRGLLRLKKRSGNSKKRCA